VCRSVGKKDSRPQGHGSSRGLWAWRRERGGRGGRDVGVPCAASPVLHPCCRHRPAGGPVREPRVRELRLHPDAAVAAGRHRPLPVQRLRPLQQDERPQPAPHQAAEARGECGRARGRTALALGDTPRARRVAPLSKVQKLHLCLSPCAWRTRGTNSGRMRRWGIGVTLYPAIAGENRVR
jgi:hypothetical protein